MDTSKLYMSLEGADLHRAAADAEERYFLVEVIRQGGPRDGDRMGWTVFDAVDVEMGLGLKTNMFQSRERGS